MRHKRSTVLLVIFSGMLLLSACSMPASTQEPISVNTRTATLAPSLTETIQWFPPTKTPTPRVTRTNEPTANLHPGAGRILLEEDFDTGSDWSSKQTEAGRVTIGNDQLTLAISTAQGSLSSLHGLILDDFYLETTASPSLCRGNDSYGLILRADEDLTYYRFVITCSGMTRFEQVKNGGLTVLQDWTPSGQVPIGAPARLRVGIWAYGDEVRLFVGDVLQYSVQKLLFLDGRIGFFARSEGTTALTVSFSDLTVYAIQGVQPTITLTPQASETP